MIPVVVAALLKGKAALSWVGGVLSHPLTSYAIVGAVVGFGGYQIRGVIADRDVSEIRREHGDQLAKLERDHAAAFAESRRLASEAYAKLVKERDNLAGQIKQQDVAFTEQRRKDRDEIERLASDVAAGRQRLRVAARCPSAGGDGAAAVSAAAGGAGVGPAGAPELDPAARPAYYALRDGLIEQRRTLMACQAILRAERAKKD